MTSETQDRRGLVAESYRYARAFYDDAEATGPAAFERNRQSIIDVIALAYRDGMASQQSDDALRVAAQEAATLAENIAAHIDDLGGSGGDTVRSIASILKAALDGAPFAPSEEMVERAVGVFLFREKDAGGLNSRMRAALRAAFSSGESPSGTGPRPTGRQ